MVSISDIIARQILDSRGNPTIEVDVKLNDGSLGRAAVPSGASTGKYEAFELRDKDYNFYNGLSVLNAIENVNIEIFNTFCGRNPFQQRDIDNDLIELDNSKNKERLGANAMLGFSMAVARSAAASMNLPLWKYIGGMRANTLPIPMMNIINGGAHANNSLDFQELMIVPFGFNRFSDALRCGAEVFQSLKKLLLNNNFSIAVGDEGGFAPNFSSHKEALDYIILAIENAGYTPGKNVSIALDVASTEFYSNNEYNLKGENKKLDSQGLIDFLDSLSREYPIISIEDGLAEDDWEGWKTMTDQIGKNVQLVGDDLFVTNTDRLSRGIKEKTANSILIKFNQIGTLTETLNAINMAKKASYTTMISHRSGETEDHFIADLAVATNAGQIKTGSLSRSDRLSKYNQLLRIEELLGENALYNKAQDFYK